MFLAGSAAIVILAVIAVVLRRRRDTGTSTAGSQRPRDPAATTSKFHAVSIRPGPSACQAAMGLQGQRFLSDAAPQLPLPGCGRQNCQCRFVHFSDRRSGDDRRSPYPATIGMDTGTYKQEQRKAPDRRSDPPNSF